MSLSNLTIIDISFTFYVRDIESKVFVTWMDNYNAKWRMKMSNIDKDSFKMANWTGVAVREYTGDIDIQLNLVTDEHGCFVPALPSRIFDYVPSVKKFILDKTEEGNSGLIRGLENFPFQNLECSLLQTWGVNRLRLKPNLDNPNLPLQYKEAIKAAPDTLANFYPKGVFPHNIGSNEGFIAMLKNYFEQFVTGNGDQKYFIITCDENIYKRAMRVLIL